MLEDKLNNTNADSSREISQSHFLSRLRKSALPYVLALTSAVAPSAYAGDQGRADVNHLAKHAGETQAATAYDIFPPLKIVAPAFDDLSLRLALKGNPEWNVQNFVSVQEDYDGFYKHMERLKKQNPGSKKFALELGIPEDKSEHVDDINIQKVFLEEVKPMIQICSKRYGIPADMLEQVVRHESGGNPLAVGGDYSLGIMQLQPGAYGSNEIGPTINPFNPEQAIERGAALLANYMKRCKTLLKENPALKESIDLKSLTLVANNLGITKLGQYVESGQYAAIKELKVAYADKILGKKPLLRYS